LCLFVKKELHLFTFQDLKSGLIAQIPVMFLFHIFWLREEGCLFISSFAYAVRISDTRQVQGGPVNNEFEGIWKEGVAAVFEVLSRFLPRAMFPN
jgi:hypothetical protein